MSDDNFIRFFKPQIGIEEISEVVECLKSGWLTTAGRTKKFEENFAAYTGAAHAIALNSCTAALHLALEAVGLQEGELVLVPTMTFAATAEVVRYFNATPVLVDCNEDDLCINTAQAEQIIKDINACRPVKGVPEKHGKIRAIIPVHYGGQVADVLRCRELCDKHKLFLIEDCAHCCPAFYKDLKGHWAMAGKTADISCYSFYANKTITTGEGGMAVTDNQEWADRMRVMSLHGISKDAWKRFSKAGSWYYEIVAPGFKYNLTDVASALGIHQLKKADLFMDERKKVAEKLTKGLHGIPGVILPFEKKDRKHAWHLYEIRIVASETGITRDAFIDRMKEAEIGCSVHYIPLHMHPYYKDKYGFVKEDFPVAGMLADEIMSLPIYPGLTDSEINRICDAVKLILKEEKKA